MRGQNLKARRTLAFLCANPFSAHLAHVDPSESKFRHSVRLPSSGASRGTHFEPRPMTVVGTPGKRGMAPGGHPAGAGSVLCSALMCLVYVWRLDFMAPELFFGKDYNETVDVFSFGKAAWSFPCPPFSLKALRSCHSMLAPGSIGAGPGRNPQRTLWAGGEQD